MFTFQIKFLLVGALLAGNFALAIAATGDPFIWPKYTPSLSYNFKERMAPVSMPTKDLETEPRLRILPRHHGLVTRSSRSKWVPKCRVCLWLCNDNASNTELGGWQSGIGQTEAATK